MSHVHVLHVSLVSKLFPSGAESAETDNCFLLFFCNCYLTTHLSVSREFHLHEQSPLHCKMERESAKDVLSAKSPHGASCDRLRRRRQRRRPGHARRALGTKSSGNHTARAISAQFARLHVQKSKPNSNKRRRTLLRKSRRPSVQHHAPTSDLYVPDPRLLFF